MKFRNVSPLGAVEVPILGRVIEHGETFEVPDDLAPLLAAQTEHYLAVDADAKAATEDALASWAAVTEEPSEEPLDVPSDAPVDEVPAGTVDDVLAWVGGDPARAAAALEAETSAPSPRSSLVGRLSALIPGSDQ